ncbi:hypothetical protein BDV98DRAFT_143662 [Pterulicium gracile]|uniref:Uncharacterized protein n=1 Tax=Pterulicium gracile TaxID=1884261 RepID=A0A5C3R0Z8_9AGAR|nr:hypothetical protein BDV98DRAFT_143662 [Pterula gracilis]
MSAPPLSSSSRSRPQQRKKQTDDAAYIGASATGVKRQAPERADGEPRQKRKKLEPIFAVAASSSRRADSSNESKAESDKAAALSFMTLPVETLYAYLSQHDIIPGIYPAPNSVQDPPPPSSFEDPVQQSFITGGGHAGAPVNRPRRDGGKEGRRRSLRLQEDDFATRPPILADLRELHAVMARLVEKHLTTQSNSTREVDTLAGFMCSVDKRRNLDRLHVGSMYPT